MNVEQGHKSVAPSRAPATMLELAWVRQCNGAGDASVVEFENVIESCKCQTFVAES